MRDRIACQQYKHSLLHSISRYLMSKVAIPIISCSCDEQKLKKLFHLEHSHIRNDDDFDDDDDAMGHGVCQIMMFVDGGGWGSGKTQNKMTSFMNSA